MDLAKVKEWLTSIPKKQLEAAKKLYPQANQLKYLCIARGWLLLDNNKRDFIIINNTPEVRQLKKVYKQLGVAGIKFTNATKTKAHKGGT
jgi:hypothetical protein